MRRKRIKEWEFPERFILEYSPANLSGMSLVAFVGGNFEKIMPLEYLFIVTISTLPHSDWSRRN